MVSFDYDGSTKTVVSSQSTQAEFIGVGHNLDYIIQFYKNPNEYSGIRSYDIELTTTVLGQRSTMQQPINNASSNGTYIIDGSTITFEGTVLSTGNTIVGDQLDNEATIAELTDTTLRLVQETTQEHTLDGLTIRIT